MIMHHSPLDRDLLIGLLGPVVILVLPEDPRQAEVGDLDLALAGDEHVPGG